MPHQRAEQGATVSANCLRILTASALLISGQGREQNKRNDINVGSMLFSSTFFDRGAGWKDSSSVLTAFRGMRKFMGSTQANPDEEAGFFFSHNTDLQ